MSLLEQASLIVTPNAYKEDVLYSVVPNDRSGDLDVVRATTATRVNADGLIEVVPKNLSSYSEQFDNAYWGKTNSTVNSNSAISPNDTLTADKFIENNGDGNKWLYFTPTVTVGNSYTYSVYAKKGERDFIYINAYSGTNNITWFNLNNGTIGTSQNGVATITNLGNGWYRCTLSVIVASGIQFFLLGVSNANNIMNYTGDGTSGLYVWGAQLEAGSTATSYFPTTDRLNIPRLDYSGGGCPSILVEPQRTNLLTYSEQFDDASWSKNNSTITSNTSIAPSGITTADTLVITSGGHLLKQVGYSSVSGQSVSISIFAKNQTTNFLTFGGATIAGTDVYTIQNYGNGWYRHIRTRTFTATSTGLIQFIIYNQVGTHIIWGAQLEAGSNATSYIPTVASTVTRNADVISKTGISGLIGQTEGTIFVDFNKKNNIESIISIDDASSNNRIFLESTGANNVKLRFISGGVTTVDNTSSILIDGKNKIAIGYANNDVVMYHNGVQIFLDNTATIPSTSVIRLGTNVTNLFQLNNGINSAQLYKTRLTNAELQALTTL